tara:strand:- start:527 stop:853 length:327 start_codon:yes stop_codon:yes gene_type:complete
LAFALAHSIEQLNRKVKPPHLELERLLFQIFHQDCPFNLLPVLFAKLVESIFRRSATLVVLALGCQFQKQERHQTPGIFLSISVRMVNSYPEACSVQKETSIGMIAYF